MRGQTTYAWCPRATSSPTRCQTRSYQRRHLGQRHHMRAHRTAPGRHLDQRRGLQVAEDGHRHGARDRRRRHHQQVWAGPALARAARPAAPPRTGAARRRRPGRGRRTTPSPAAVRGCRSRCPAAPDAASSIAVRRAATLIEPVSSTTLATWSAGPPSSPSSARSPSIAVIERWCCAASTSVGASSAAWPPASATVSIARSATTVLPEPTSPCSSRCIGRDRARSSAICSPTSSWTVVSTKGSARSNASSRPPARLGRGVAATAWSSARRCASTTCRTNASSKENRRRAA